jgi:hypothetical protein
MPALLFMRILEKVKEEMIANNDKEEKKIFLKEMFEGQVKLSNHPTNNYTVCHQLQW